MKHSRDFLGSAYFDAYASGLPGAPTGSATTASTWPATRCPSASTTSRPRGARSATAGRPAQRERRYAHGADLRLALPEEHPPLGDGRRQPARATSSGTRGPTTSRSASTPAPARADDACSSRTDDLAATLRDLAGHPDRWGSCRSSRGNARIGAFFGLMDSTRRGRAALRADDDRRVALRRGGRPERPLAPVAARNWSSRSVQVKGDAGGGGAHRRRVRAALLRGAARPAARSSAAPATDFLWAGGRLLDAWPANPDENEYCRVRDSQRRDAARSAATSTSRRRRRPPRGSCCPTCRTATRSSCPGSGTPTTSGATSRRRARTSSTPSSTAAGSTPRATRREPRRLHAGFPQTTLAKIVLAALLGFARAHGALAARARRAGSARRGRLGRKTSAALPLGLRARPRPRRLVHRRRWSR